MAHHPRAMPWQKCTWLRMSKMLESDQTNPSVVGELLSGAITILCETYHGMRTSLSQERGHCNVVLLLL